ncbi:putative KIF 1 binding protein C terminal [Trypanosoma vivax]|nr:putative KIF 1 binding protein C terminal [Trypanosoma vivax]
MRMAQLQLKLSFKLPMEEYKNISSSLEMFDKAVDFVSANPMEPGVDKEVALCREMVALLPVKQNDILRVYNRRT